MRPVSNQSRSYSQFAGRPDEYKRKQNLFDLSHDVKTTFSMGQLIPFLCLETLPSDNFIIDFECFTRFAPLYLPIMHRCDLTINYFYVPNRCLWVGAQNGNEGSLGDAGNWMDYITQNRDLVAPYIIIPADAISINPVTGTGPGIAYSLHDYLGFPTDNITGGGSSINSMYVNAFPFAAFWKIYDEYYRNPQVEDAMSYILVAGENDLSDWPSYYPGPGDFGLFVPYKLWNRDYFTACLPTPQVGADVQIPLVNMNFDNSATGIDPGEIGGPYRWRNYVTHTPADNDNIAVSLSDTGTAGGTSLTAGDPIYLDIQETAAPMREFRLAARMLEFLERLMRIGSRYRDFLKGQFGVDPDPGTIDLPVYIGGSKGRVIISEVMATAETTNDTDVLTPLGAYAGQALAMESAKRKIKYFCKEHGIIIGIINIQPRTSYMQGLSRMWTRGVNNGASLQGTIYDYAFEQFAAIGDQAVKFKELRYDYNNAAPNIAHNEATFGYIPRYSEYRWHNDIISAQMRTIWTSFHLGRIFTQDLEDSLLTPVLDREFVSCRPRVADVFQIGAAQDHEIYCHIFNNVHVWRQLPKFGIPSL